MMAQHCTIVVDLDHLGVRARVRDNKLILDVPDDKLEPLRRCIGAEVEGLQADLAAERRSNHPVFGD